MKSYHQRGLALGNVTVLILLGTAFSRKAMSERIECSVSGLKNLLSIKVDLQPSDNKIVFNATDQKTKQRYGGELDEKGVDACGRGMMDPESLSEFIRSALATVKAVSPTSDDKITVQGGFFGPDDLKFSSLLKSFPKNGEAEPREGRSLLVYITYKPDSFIRLNVPLLLTELETSALNRLESRVDDLELSRAAPEPVVDSFALSANNSPFSWTSQKDAGGAENFQDAANVADIVCAVPGTYMITLSLSTNGNSCNGHQVTLTTGQVETSAYCHQYGIHMTTISQLEAGGVVRVALSGCHGYFPTEWQYNRLIIQKMQLQ